MEIGNITAKAVYSENSYTAAAVNYNTSSEINESLVEESIDDEPVIDIDDSNNQDNQESENTLITTLTELNNLVDKSSRVLPGNVVSKPIDKESGYWTQYGDERDLHPSQVLTESELYFNLTLLLESSNQEISGIAKVFAEIFEKYGIDVPDGDSVVQNEYANIILETVFNAIKGKELESDEIYEQSANSQKGLTIADLMSLDKNSDGSIVEELKELLNSTELNNVIQNKISEYEEMLKKVQE